MALDTTAPWQLLLVEDNDVEREGLITLLRRAGYRVTAVRTVSEALASFRAHRPDLVLLDMLLPDGDGWSVLSVIRGTPVLVITGLGIAPTEWTRSLGALDVIPKPIETDELLQKVRRYCP